MPGRGVAGGDWYDVFTLPPGELYVVIGDVAGSGLPQMTDAAANSASDSGSPLPDYPG